MPNIQVLLIDDEKDIAENLADLFNSTEGFRAKAVASGERGVKEIGDKKAEENPYDVVICDLLMPEVDGIDVLKKALFLDPYICFIMLTGYGSIDSAVEAMDLGAYSYIEKPLKRSLADNISLIKKGVAEKKISRIRHAVHETRDEIYIIELISDAIKTLFEFREYFLAVIKRDGQDFKIIKKEGKFKENDLSNRGFIKEIIKTKKRIVELDMDENKKAVLNPLTQESKSLLAEPFIIHSEILGLIEIESNKENAFNFFDQRIIADLADTAALALNNANYIQKEIYKLREQKCLIECINHRIKTPLWSIIGRIEIIKDNFDQNLPDKVKGYIDDIWENAKKAEKLIRETLIGYRDAEKVVEIGEIFGYLKSDYKNVGSLTWFNNKELLETKIKCKPRQIEMVLRNVIDNAIDVVKDLGEEGKVTIKGELGDHAVQIEIKDNGKGIPDKIRKKIFDTPYVTTKENIGGTGLGLYMAYRIIIEHDGSMTFITSENGTTFLITLPVL